MFKVLSLWSFAEAVPGPFQTGQLTSLGWREWGNGQGQVSGLLLPAEQAAGALSPVKSSDQENQLNLLGGTTPTAWAEIPDGAHTAGSLQGSL